MVGWISDSSAPQMSVKLTQVSRGSRAWIFVRVGEGDWLQVAVAISFTMTKGLILAMKLINLAENRNRLTCFNPGYYDYRGQAVLCLRFEDDDRPTGSR